MENRKASGVPDKRELERNRSPATRREALRLGLYSLAAGGFGYMTWQFIRGGQGNESVICFSRAPESGAVLFNQGVYLVCLDNGIQAFSSRCPHLGCRLTYLPQTHRFECPCHGSVFSLDGRRLYGPAPFGMTALDLKTDEKCGAYRVILPSS